MTRPRTHLLDCLVHFDPNYKVYPNNQTIDNLQDEMNVIFVRPVEYYITSIVIPESRNVIQNPFAHILLSRYEIEFVYVHPIFHIRILDVKKAIIRNNWKDYLFEIIMDFERTYILLDSVIKHASVIFYTHVMLCLANILVPRNDTLLIELSALVHRFELVFVNSILESANGNGRIYYDIVYDNVIFHLNNMEGINGRFPAPIQRTAESTRHTYRLA